MPYWICEVCNNENLHTLDNCELCGEKGSSEAIQRARTLALEEEQEAKRLQEEAEKEAKRLQEEAEKEAERRRIEEEKERKLENYKRRVAFLLNSFIRVSKACSLLMNGAILLSIGYLLINCLIVGGVDATRVYLQETLKNFIVLVSDVSIISNAIHSIEAFCFFIAQFLEVMLGRIGLLLNVLFENVSGIIVVIVSFFNIFSEESAIRKLLEMVLKNVVAFYQIVEEQVIEVIKNYF